MCLNPIKATLERKVAEHTFTAKDGTQYTKGTTYTIGKPKFTPEGDLKLPCGKCTECISQRAVEWATRAKHEIAMHNENSFITLTYNDENLPSTDKNDPNYFKEVFKKFVKRLRKHLKREIRYMVSHEYGSQFFRPHHHMIVFGYNPPNQKFIKTSPSGEKLFTSDEIEKIWGLGFHSIGTANEKSAYYIASYALKGKKHSIILPNGEIKEVSDTFNVSTRPAIGYHYLIREREQLIDSKSQLPRYYQKKLKDKFPELYERFENDRINRFKNRSSHELLAKYTLDQVKVKNINNEYRTAPDTNEHEKYMEKNLKYERDNYQHLKKD